MEIGLPCILTPTPISPNHTHFAHPRTCFKKHFVRACLPRLRCSRVIYVSHAKLLTCFLLELGEAHQASTKAGLTTTGVAVTALLLEQGVTTKR